MRSYKYFDIIVAAFVAVLLISNIASSAKIIDWGVSIFGLRLVFDAGTLLFPLTPMTYAVVGFLKSAEKEDFYDRETDFNPFLTV
jgi:uncharacterized phage infection (PIP) family protein YhgE